MHLVINKKLRLFAIFSLLCTVLLAVACQKESDGDFDEDDDDDTEETTGGSSNTSGGMTGTWARNDGLGTAYLRLSGTTATTCTSGTLTVGTYNASASTMTFIISGETIIFPLSMKNGSLIVGRPAQANANQQPTPYISTTTWPCATSTGGGSAGGGSTGGGGTTTPAKGTVIVWTNKPATGWEQGTTVMNVSVSTVAGGGSSIYAGHYTSAPSCGAVYCYTVSVEPGQHVVEGKVYFLKPLVGPTPATYSTSKQVTVVSNQCVSVMLN